MLKYNTFSALIGIKTASYLGNAGLIQENERLRKENRLLREEREILKKATVFFAKQKP